MSQQTNQQPQRSEGKVTGLKGLVERSCYEALGAAIAAIELYRQDKDAGERLIKMVDEKLGFLDTKDRPDNAARKVNMEVDLEADLEPAIEWLRFRDGLKTIGQKADSEEEPTIAESIETRVKEWLLNLSPETKVACTLMDNYCLEDHNTKDLWEAISENYDESVLDIARNPDKYPSELVFFAGICAESDIWRNHC
jgi:hypothetical protein